MESCHYEELNTNVLESTRSIKSILKQILICSVAAVQFFIVGLCFGVTTVLIPQMRQQANSAHVIEDEMASWLYSTSALATYPWIFILPVATNYWGRKLPQLVTSVCSTAVFIIFYFSQNPYHIITAQILVGFLIGGNLTYRILTVVEYSSLEYRGMFLAIKSASGYWGMWVANAVGTFYPWKYVALIGFVCSIYTFNVFIWPVSPFWLAKQGKFEECKASYQWLHGRNQKTDQEIQGIIQCAQADRSARKISVFEMIKLKGFYKPASVCIVMIIQYHFSGIFVCSLYIQTIQYILDIFKSITEGDTAAYTAMLILDGVTVAGMYFGSYLSKIVMRRTLYLSSSFIAVFLLFAVSAYLFIVKSWGFDRDVYIIILLLTLYSLSISCGPPILALSIYGELIPTKFQTSCYIIAGLTYTVCYSALVKSAPLTYAHFGVHGTFFFYGITCGLCTVYLYFYLPETKNKTQHEIDQFFVDNKIEEELKSLQ